jgi:hypothetical protein
MQSAAVAPQRSSAVRAHKASQGACLACGATFVGAARALDALDASVRALAEAVALTAWLTPAGSARLHAPTSNDASPVIAGTPTTRRALVRRACLSRFRMSP